MSSLHGPPAQTRTQLNVSFGGFVEQELRTKCLGGCTPETDHPCTLCRFEECNRLGPPGGFVQNQKLGLSH